jgi:fimbrial chaperone protein
MRKLRILGRLMFAGLVVAAAPALAGIRVQPMSYDLMPSGVGTQQNLRVENTGSTPAAVEVTVERRHILSDGSEKREPADDDFLVFPPQGVVPANGFQTFRVQYIGDPTLQKTALYTITIAQLPVDPGSSSQTGVQIVFHLGTLAAVSPANSKPSLTVTSVTPSTDPDKLAVHIDNHGNRYARLRGGQWTLTGGDGKKQVLDPDIVAKSIEQPLIEPGTERVVDLPVPAGFVRTGAHADYELNSPSK